MWNVGTFFFEDDNTLQASSAAEALFYVHLASVGVSLGGAASGSPEQRVGNVLAGMQRSIEIGGVVLDYGLETNALDGADVGAEFYLYNALVIDRQYPETTEAIVPASIQNFRPFSSTPPTAALLTGAPIPEAEEIALPTRILWSRREIYDVNPGQIVNDLEGVLYYPNTQKVRLRNQTLNKRLRVRLSDEQGLYFVWGFRNGSTFNPNAAARNIRRWLAGHIYYRYRQ